MSERAAPSSAVPILFTVRELNHGGIERDAAKIAIHMDRSRFEPHVASYHAEGRRYEELRHAGVPMLHLPVASLKSPTAVRMALRLARYIRRHGIRLVHAWDASAIFAAPVARAAGARAILSSQLGSRELLDIRTHRLLQWTDRVVDRIVVNCEAMRHHMTADEHASAEKIDLCYNGYDTQEFFPLEAPRPEPLEGASFVIGTICVLRPEKALDLLQEAFARIAHLDRGMKLMIVGNGPELPKLRENSKRLGIGDASVFIPGTSDVPRYLRNTDIFVLSSHSEAFSNALLEAMACGCCTVGSRVGGTPELLGENERGLLFRPGDASDLAEKLAQLIENPGLRKELSRRAAGFAKSTLSIEAAVARISEIYESALRRKIALSVNLQ